MEETMLEKFISDLFIKISKEYNINLFLSSLKKQGQVLVAFAQSVLGRYGCGEGCESFACTTEYECCPRCGSHKIFEIDYTDTDFFDANSIPFLTEALEEELPELCKKTLVESG